MNVWFVHAGGRGGFGQSVGGRASQIGGVPKDVRCARNDGETRTVSARGLFIAVDAAKFAAFHAERTERMGER